MECPIKFFPEEIKKYREELVFEVNGTYKVNILIVGEGVPIRLNLLKESNRLVKLGEIRSGQQSIRSVVIVNNSRISAKFRLTTGEKEVSRLQKLHGLSDAKDDPESVLRMRALMEDPLSAHLGQYGVRCNPTSHRTLRPHQQETIEFIYYPDKPMPKFREDVYIDVVGQAPKKLLSVAGACFGIGAKLDTNSVPFGAIVKGTQISKTIQLENTGEAGIRFSFLASMAGPNFTIKPTDGFIPPKERVNIQVSFHPSEFNNDIRIDKIPCLIDKQQHENMFVTLTGACVPPRTDSKILRFDGPVRSLQHKTVTIQNPTGNSWDELKVQIANQYWYGKPSLKVPARSSATYELWYKPLTMTAGSDVQGEVSRPKQHEGSLFFALPNGDAVLYKLIGTASAAAPIRSCTHPASGQHPTIGQSSMRLGPVTVLPRRQKVLRLPLRRGAALRWPARSSAPSGART